MIRFPSRTTKAMPTRQTFRRHFQNHMQGKSKQRRRSVAQKPIQSPPPPQNPPPTKGRTLYQSFIPTPKIPGGSRPLFQRENIPHLTGRITLFLTISYILTHEDTPQLSPLHLDAMNGPSMIPTIWPGGELYLRDSLRHSILSSSDEDDYYSWATAVGIRRELRVGDVIVFVDHKGQHCCKRIVGVAGDVVCRDGEFASTLFKDEKGFGVPPLGDDGDGGRSDRFLGGYDGGPSLHSPSSQTQRLGGGGGEGGANVVTVPDGYVWVEGDNPLYSIDSRHYGPLPLSNVSGRIIYRVWPRRRRRTVGIQSGDSDEVRAGDDNPEKRINSCFVSAIRPRPIALRWGQHYGGG